MAVGVQLTVLAREEALKRELLCELHTHHVMRKIQENPEDSRQRSNNRPGFPQ